MSGPFHWLSADCRFQTEKTRGVIDLRVVRAGTLKTLVHFIRDSWLC